MKSKENFFNTVCNLAIPVALQSMMQASFSIIDQIMIGQLGTVNVAGVGFAGKFSFDFKVSPYDLFLLLFLYFPDAVPFNQNDRQRKIPRKSRLSGGSFSLAEHNHFFIFFNSF